MLYDSLGFAAFLGVVAGLYHLCPPTWRRWYLLAVSYAFYCTWSVPFAFLLVAVTGVAYVLARRVHDATSDTERRLWFNVGLILLLLPLATFKYAAWLGGGLASVMGDRAGFSSLQALRLLVPVGISYYTLKLVGYLVDVHLGVQPCGQFSAVATCAAFFPQTLAGPIHRVGDFLQQVGEPKTPRAAMVGSGIRLMLFGLFKKLVLADRLGLIVDQVFARPDAFSGLILAAASYLYVIQLYADFSGLTDVAIGAGRLFGIDAPQNFNAPFIARSIPEFWRRWHMTLTSWVTDYVFMPLRVALRDLGQVGLAISIMINMLAIGVWHGASWNFVVFGFIHGCYLVVSSLTLRQREKFYDTIGFNKIHRVTGPIVTFHMVVAAAIFFRASSVRDAWYILGQICGMLFDATVHFGRGVTAGIASGAVQLNWRVEDACVAAGAAVLMETVHLLRRDGRSVSAALALPPWVRLGGCYALALAILLWGQSESKQFIYAQF
jgi:alginate O-acetyltransferase complex protein AlgI